MRDTDSSLQHILYVDLTAAKLRMEKIVAAALLARMIDPPLNPLSPDAPLIFSMGTLTGTNAQMSGRSSITFVSPATALYCKASAGGHFGLYCRMNGIDHIVIRGVSKTPVFLSIGPVGAEILNASHLWGKKVRETTRVLEKEYDDPVSAACIGPAGENGVLYASIMSSFYSAAARGGGRGSCDGEQVAQGDRCEET